MNKPEVMQVVLPVKSMMVGGASSEFQRTFTASVRASDRVELAFQVPGKLIELPVLLKPCKYMIVGSTN